MNNSEISSFIGSILGNSVGEKEIKADKNGWVDVVELLHEMEGAGYDIGVRTLRNIVSTDSEKRYDFNWDRTRIRLNREAPV